MMTVTMMIVLLMLLNMIMMIDDDHETSEINQFFHHDVEKEQGKIAYFSLQLIMTISDDGDDKDGDDFIFAYT